MRTKIVAGNWKMNKNLQETEALLTELAAKRPDTDAEIIVSPTFVNLAAAVRHLESSIIQVAAQNMHFAPNGAFTGEISADMLKNIGVEIVILGHSERRSHFGETDSLLKQKVETAIENTMRIIFCFGEELAQRKAGTHFKVVEEQLKSALFDLKAKDWDKVILAYEPVWAIGTGETATPEQAQEMHAFIRKTISDAFGDETANTISILYGGSVKPNNARDIFSKPDVDGGLIGGASLKADDFIEIVKAI